MRPSSPFQYMRWETDEEKIICLPPEFPEWLSQRSLYITGPRGTGKTTLLKSFEWEQILYNDSLKSQLRQLNIDPFEKGFIGVYLDMPDFVTRHFDNWPPQKEGMDDLLWEEDKARVFCLYLEYQILQLLIKAIQELYEVDILNFSPDHQIKTVRKILNERPEIKFFMEEKKGDYVLDDLRLCFKRMHENIRSCAIQESPLEPKKGYPYLQLGQMLEEVASSLLELCSMEEDVNVKNKNGRHWIMKICIDQCESSSIHQMKAINTMIARQKKGDVSFAVASLEGVDIESTYLPRHTLTDSDREHYSLEQVYGTPSRFEDFVLSVTKLRFEKFIGPDCKKLSLKEILGEWDLNSLVYPYTKQSESEDVKGLIKRAKENIGIDFFDINRKSLPIEFINERISNEIVTEKTIPPIWQTYLVEKLNLKFPHEESDKHKIRAQKSREIRKKMVAAMLCMCKEYGIHVPYAGYSMVIAMSDRSIRDFLRQMHYIYIEQKKKPEKFIMSFVDPVIQDKAIRNASNKKFDGISDEMEYYSSEVKRLVEALGRLTSGLQSAYKDPSALKSTERGLFSIDLSLMKSDERKELKKIIGLARDSFYLKTENDFFINKDIKKIIFRLSNLFAPRFEYSYRGSYYQFPVYGSQLLAICKEEDEKIATDMISDILFKVIEIQNIRTLDQY
jgi:hypothetical protein